MIQSSAPVEGTPRQLLVIAAIFAAVGVRLLWAASTRHPALHVPPAIAQLVAAVCLTASAAAVAKAFRRHRVLEGLVAAVLVGMALTGGWIAVGSHGGCRTSLPLQGAARAIACRAGFGVGALLTAAIALWALVRWWRGRDGAGDGTRVGAR